MIFNPSLDQDLTKIATTFNLKESNRIEEFPYLTKVGERVVLAFDYPVSKYLFFDFFKYQKVFSKINFKNDLFFKAFNVRKYGNKAVDLTCGTAKDSFHMVAIGLTVEAYERNVYTYILLNDAAKIFSNVDYGYKFSILDERLVINFNDAKLVNSSDTLFLDPIFKMGTKSLPKKEMQILREISDDDERDLFCHFRNMKKNRMIVKRYIHGDAINKPDYQILGKTIRLDIYNH